MALSIVTAGIALFTVLVQLTTEPFVWMGVRAAWYNGISYGIGVVILLVACQYCFDSSIALPCIYMVFCQVSRMGIGTILQYYYTAPEECPRGAEVPFKVGPRFDVPYYQTVSGYGGTIAGLAGIALFDRTVQYWPVRAAFWVTTAMNMTTTIFDLMMIERWNQSIFGFDPDTNPSVWVDRGFFILGAQAIDKLVDTLDDMPLTVLIGKLCPKGSEAQVFAILAALVNFGGNVSSITGSIVAQLVGVSFLNKGGEWTCSNPVGPLGISNLGWLKIWATFILPALTIPATFWLLPDMRLNDDFLNENEDGDTELQEGPPLKGAPTRPLSAVASYKSADAALWTSLSKGTLQFGKHGDMNL